MKTLVDRLRRLTQGCVALRGEVVVEKGALVGQGVFESLDVHAIAVFVYRGRQGA